MDKTYERYLRHKLLTKDRGKRYARIAAELVDRLNDDTLSEEAKKYGDLREQE